MEFLIFTWNIVKFLLGIFGVIFTIVGITFVVHSIIEALEDHVLLALFFGFLSFVLTLALSVALWKFYLVDFFFVI